LEAYLDWQVVDNDVETNMHGTWLHFTTMCHAYLVLNKNMAHGNV
jgi:hypothetical protein